VEYNERYYEERQFTIVMIDELNLSKGAGRGFLNNFMLD